MFARFKQVLVHGVSALLTAGAAFGLNVFHSGVSCLKDAYAQIGDAAPALQGVADSLSANAASQGAEPSYLALAVIFGVISSGIGYGASKLPGWK